MVDGGEREHMYVADQASGETIFGQPLGEWFRHGLIARSLWAAARTGLGGVRVVPVLETISENGRILGWQVTLSQDGGVVFRRHWPVTLFHGTAIAVADQCRDWLGDGHVVFWAARPASPTRDGSPPDLGVEFDQDEGATTVPELPVGPPPCGRQLVPSAGWPVELVLALSPAAQAALMCPIDDASAADVEVAWAGPAVVTRQQSESTLTYHVAQLSCLASPEASATRCPISPENLVGAMPLSGPMVLVHTHPVPAGIPPDEWSTFLRSSYEDFRALLQLPMGSLSVVAAGRPPLQLRVYGWSADGGSLQEINATVLVLGENPDPGCAS